MTRYSNNTALNYLSQCVDSTSWSLKTGGSGSAPSLSVSTGSGSVTIATASTTIIGENLSRATATFVNDSNEIIYLRLGSGSANAIGEGIRLNANGGAFEINSTNLFSGSVSAICLSGSKNLCYTETTYI